MKNSVGVKLKVLRQLHKLNSLYDSRKYLGKLDAFMSHAPPTVLTL